MIKVLIVDDHLLLRESLSLSLRNRGDIEIIGSIGNSDELYSMLKNIIPDVILMDIRLRYENGIKLTKNILEKYPRMKIIMLSMLDEYEYIASAFSAGAQGYILKDCSREEFLTGIKAVYNGKKFVSDSISKILANVHIESIDKNKNFYGLNEREMEVVKRFADGQCSKEIASDLKVSFKTIDKQKIKIMNKMGFKTFSDLIKYAVTKGLSK